MGQNSPAQDRKYGLEKERVSVVDRHVARDPGAGGSRREAQGTRLVGKVTNLTDSGAFV